MPKKIDLTGQAFGRLYVIKQSDYKGKGAYWECRCTCGASNTVSGRKLIAGLTRSCGCAKGFQRRNPDLVSEWTDLYQEGYNLPEIAEMYEKTVANIYDALKDIVELKRNNCGMKRIKRIDEWVAQYQFGIPAWQIAKRSDFSVMAVNRALSERGFDLMEDYGKRLKNKSKQQAEILLEVYKKGYSPSELSQVFDLSASRIKALLTEFCKDELRTYEQAIRLRSKKQSALTNDSRAINLATDRHDLKPITHKTKDLRWGQDNYDINRREHIL